MADLPTTQSSWEEEHTQRMMRPEAGDPSTSVSNYRRPRMGQVSATTHRFHSAHPRSPTHLQSLGSKHLDLTALTVATGSSDDDAFGSVGCSPATAHTSSRRRPGYGHRLRVRDRFHSICYLSAVFTTAQSPVIPCIT